MNRLLLLGAACTLALGLACEQAVVNTGTITVKNNDPQEWGLLVSAENNCTMGLRTRIGPNTQTTFDVDKTVGSWICVNEKGPPIKVEDGKQYQIAGGQLSAR